MRPRFLITIDTEGDSLWAGPREITTRNSRYLPRFQQLCERYGQKPTYLTNYEMANCPDFIEFASDVLRRGQGEVGMHLHAWNSPPVEPLTQDDYRYQPYLMEYPEPLLREKVKVMTRLLEDRFQQRMTSHRAGRWGLDGVYVRVLEEQGYLVDCSVVPRVSFRRHTGNPAGQGGSDYSEYPSTPYRLNPAKLSEPALSGILEVPMTVANLEPDWVKGLKKSAQWSVLGTRVLGRIYPPMAWLRPRGGNAGEMIRIVRQGCERKQSYVEFMLHSSEFMPGGSPVFPTEESIEQLYEDLEKLFAFAQGRTEAATLSEFARQWLEKGIAA